MVDEKKLLVRLKRHETNSIESAVEIYTPYLVTVIYKMAGTSLPKEDVEEIVSDVFIMLWKNAELIDLQKGTIRSYIAAAARNFALKRLNRKREYDYLNDVELCDEESVSEYDPYSEFIWNCVMELGEPDNEIFVRFYKYNERLKDISKATGLNLSTVKTKLSRGRQKLKKILSNAEESL